MASRRRRRWRKKLEVFQDLDLMPLLNVFISIIPLLLLSAAFVQLAVIPTALPANADAPAPPAPAATAASLTIEIHCDTYVVRADGATTGTIPRPPATDASAIIAARERLGAALAGFAAAHPGHREVRIVADPTTRYEDIIDVMDVSRGAGLPEAALADGVPGAAQRSLEKGAS